LEKTSKIIKSSHQPNTTMPAKPYPEVQYLHVFWTPQGWWLHHFLGSLFQCLTKGWEGDSRQFPSVVTSPNLSLLSAVPFLHWW